MTRKILIYGSCVSRDAFEFFGDEWQLAGYVARQSMISALSKPTGLLSGPDLASGFQNRMVNGDLASNLLVTLRRYARDIDVLLLDLTDERLGVLALPDGSFVSRSRELVDSGRLDGLDKTPVRVPFGTERHWMLWKTSATRIVDALKQLQILDKVIVVDTPWALRTSDGASTPDGLSNVTNNQANDYFARCVGHLLELGLDVRTLPSELQVADPNHKWTVAPYHYIDDASRWIAEQV